MSGRGDLSVLEHAWHVQKIAALYRAFEFAGVVVEEHGHIGHDECDHPVHVLEALTFTAVGSAVDKALKIDGITIGQIRHDLRLLELSGVEVANVLGIFSTWQDRQQ